MSHRHRHRHRRTNSAVEGSAAQAFLLDSISLSDVNASMMGGNSYINMHNKKVVPVPPTAASQKSPHMMQMSPIVDDVVYTSPTLTSSVVNANDDDEFKLSLSNDEKKSSSSSASFDNGGWLNLSTMKKSESNNNATTTATTSSSSSSTSSAAVPNNDNKQASSSMFRSHNATTVKASSRQPDFLSGIQEASPQADDGFVITKETVATTNDGTNLMCGERFGLGADYDRDDMIVHDYHDKKDQDQDNDLQFKEQLDRMEQAIWTMEKNLGEWRDHFDKSLGKVISVMQQETARRTALENRLHAQLVLQSENMVAMELKLLRLEAKATTVTTNASSSSNAIHNNNIHHHHHHQHSSTASLSTGGVTTEEHQDVAVLHLDRVSSSIDRDRDVVDQDNDDDEGTSTRATRGPPGSIIDDGETSTLATSVATGTTVPSTTCSTTRGQGQNSSSNNHLDSILGLSSSPSPRSRSHSPLTGNTRRPIGTATNTNTELSSRVVSFNVNNFMSSGASQSNLSYDGTQEDSLTLNSASATNLDADADADADDMNTITTGNSADFGGTSTIEAFQASSRLWREEYEGRLDAIQKRFG
mmetsp:Transcript_22942/g.35319  ORF Transcript_22942/g.35319 Transcript_22942/m.35319 type:complete len:587 (-) Transcript_22942:192-1952(-)|eukprot:CAMPEP_0196807286 /NCGR_PEP_ID=MMETSP1362-20130617/7244_1 /TAXON_ID=163516 /ORGANISM="Leptocylindrus danicus, Strain CCMP1856" /LENGTH=586 /DNA_ID=CAMNT_0042181131 /DNA_START=32 /DNA_END=1792 /DNA_ORIENTATION=-